MKDNLFTESLRHSVGYRIFLYLVILLICTLVGGLVSFLMVIGNNDNLLKLGQGISSALMFIVHFVAHHQSTVDMEREHASGLAKT